ncbi:MAG: M23 family metallopeptidase [Candidatus Nanoarchaeia archaeon]
MKKYFWPVPSAKKQIPRGKRKRGFGRNEEDGRFHAGTDILAKYGSDVISIENGIVKNIFLFTYPKLDKFHKYENTYAIVIQNQDKNYTLYGEIQKPKLKIGEEVKAGQKIAKVGRIFADRPEHTMLHFEYHSKLPKSTTKWYIGKKPKSLLNSTNYLKKVIK